MVNIIVNGSLRRNVKPCRKAESLYPDQNVFQGSVLTIYYIVQSAKGSVCLTFLNHGN